MGSARDRAHLVVVRLDQLAPPYAGASSSIYRGWQEFFAEVSGVVGVEIAWPRAATKRASRPVDARTDRSAVAPGRATRPRTTAVRPVRAQPRCAGRIRARPRVH